MVVMPARNGIQRNLHFTRFVFVKIGSVEELSSIGYRASLFSNNSVN